MLRGLPAFVFNNDDDGGERTNFLDIVTLGNGGLESSFIFCGGGLVGNLVFGEPELDLDMREALVLAFVSIDLAIGVSFGGASVFIMSEMFDGMLGVTFNEFWSALEFNLLRLRHGLPSLLCWLLEIDLRRGPAAESADAYLARRERLEVLSFDRFRDLDEVDRLLQLLRERDVDLLPLPLSLELELLLLLPTRILDRERLRLLPNRLRGKRNGRSQFALRLPLPRLTTLLSLRSLLRLAEAGRLPLASANLTSKRASPSPSARLPNTSLILTPLYSSTALFAALCL